MSEDSECGNWREAATRRQATKMFEGKAWHFNKPQQPEVWVRLTKACNKLANIQNQIKSAISASRDKLSNEKDCIECLDELKFAVCDTGFVNLFCDFTFQKRDELKAKWPEERSEIMRAFLYYRWKFTHNDFGFKELLVLLHYMMLGNSTERLWNQIKSITRKYMWDPKYCRLDRAINTMIHKYDLPIIGDRNGKLRFKYYSLQEVELTHDLVGSCNRYTVVHSEGPAGIPGPTTRVTFE